ncbi:MAG: hypothetical protein PHR26_02985 [Candidatus ainarchaeum sp.]|nr:hypothetical protein [Candidatus ainarchaeum sp.]MDD3975564.1 hypothetical protein [Candidatus ainarchaeum sp.]
MLNKYKPISKIILKLKKENIYNSYKYKKALKKRASNSILAKSYPREYKRGIFYIKKIINLKEMSLPLYVIGKQSDFIFKNMPELEKQNTLRDIFIATNNSFLDIYKIDSLVKSIFSKNLIERREIIFEIIFLFSKESYDYLFS